MRYEPDINNILNRQTSATNCLLCPMFNQQHTNDSCVVVNQNFYYGMDTPISINRGIEIPHYRNTSYI